MKRNLFFWLAAGAALSGAGFYFAFRNVPAGLLAESLEQVNYLWVIPGAAAGLLSFALRAERWRLILGSTLKLPFLSAFHPLMIGFMINSLLPGRVGELARPAIIKKQEGVAFALGLTTVAAERILDALTLILLFALVLASVHIDPNLQIEFMGRQLDRGTLENVSATLLKVCIIGAAAIGAVCIPAVERLVKKIIIKAPYAVLPEGSRLAAKIVQKCCIPLTRMLGNVISGLSMVKHPAVLLLCVFYSFVIWLMQAFALYVLSLGFPGILLGAAEVTAVFIIICLFIMLPSVPGYWGLWEAGGVFGLALFGVASNTAAGFALISHVMLMIPVVLVGLYSAVSTGINIVRISADTARRGVDMEP
ncbi:MAG: lysylphosphatidylglycerol synthase transmembrane domain-containing protein [Desulfosalsimonas sp.]